MSRWFRLYDELLDDPKAQRLPPADFKVWINLLCLASRNDGTLPPIADIAFALRMDENAIVTVLERLANATLIDKHNGGVDGFHYVPHGWDKRQYKSDNSTERSTKFRAKKRNVSCNVAATPPDTDTDTDTEAEKKKEEGPRKRVVAVDLPEWMPVIEWAGWLDMRKAKRSAASPRAQQLAIAKLNDLKREGHDPGAVLDQSTLKGWTDLYPIKESDNGKQSSNGDANQLGQWTRAVLKQEARRKAAGGVEADPFG